MKLNKIPFANKEVQYFTFDLFEKTGFVRHAFSTKIGGVSCGCFESMNLWLGSCNQKRAGQHDTLENVYENYSIFSNAVGFDLQNMVFSDQVHETSLVHVSNSDRGKGIKRDNDIKNADGLVTNHKNVVLTTFYADCVPLFFLDPAIGRQVIALSHAGWKGTHKRIAEVTVAAMNNNYGCRPENILCGIGPAIGKCCYEVDLPVADAFIKEFDFVKNDTNGDFITASLLDDKFRLNLKQINKRILLEAGIRENNIEIAELCTRCNPELFYSHRKAGKNRGQMAAVLELI